MPAHTGLHVRINFHHDRAENIIDTRGQPRQRLLHLRGVHLAHHGERDNQEAESATENVHKYAYGWDEAFVVHAIPSALDR